MKKNRKILAAIMGLMIVFSITVSADSPYKNYTYSSEKEKQCEPQAVYATKSLDGFSMNIGRLAQPSDIFIFDNKLYISDTGNNRIVICGLNGENAYAVNSFLNNGKTDTFNTPTGLFVTEDGLIYICDTENGRIVVLNPDGTLNTVYTRPDTKLLADDVIYKPTRVVVDSAKRIFVISDNVNLGIIELDKNGQFVGFFGAIEVQYNAYEYFLKMIATDEQKATMSVTVPTEYSNIDIDEKGFIYTTVNVFDRGNFREDIFIRRLNPLGNDVLIRDGYNMPMGDVVYETDVETNQKLTSSFVDIKCDVSGIYSALDAKYGRIFTYNKQGYLMYVFGGLGDSLGQFDEPVAIEISGDNYFVLDRNRGNIVIFSPTEYGQLFKKAIVSYEKRDYEAADNYWNNALKYTGKSQMVYYQIGKTFFKNEQYEDALKYFKFSNKREGYSQAFEKLRVIIIDKSFTTVLVLIMLVIVGFAVIKTVKRFQKSRKAENKKQC